MKRLTAKILLMFMLAALAFGADKPANNDGFLYDTIRTRLASDVIVKGGAIELDVKDGVVTLKGHVQEPKQKARAEALAKKVKGVKSVINELQIQPQ